MEYFGRLFVIIFVVVSFSCKNEGEINNLASDKRFKSFIENYEKEKNTTNFSKLMQSIGKAYREADNFKEKEALLLFGLQFTQDSDKEDYASLLKKELSKVNPNHQLSQSYLIDYAMIANQTNQSNLASIYFDGYMRTHPKGRFFNDVKYSIDMDTSLVKDYVRSLAREAFDAKDSLKMPAILKYKEAAEAFAISHPRDTMSGVYLFNAAELLREAGSTPDALELYDWIFNYFPTYSKSSTSLFMRAFIVDQTLKKPAEAKKLYQKMIETYPKDELADDAKFMLENMGADNSELLEQITKK
ncbi:MAG: hypothetical protein R2774_06200 [Saprospiraceae bacterium]